MRRLSLGILLSALMGLAAPALADPGIRVDYRGDALQIMLDGSYVGSYYQVSRAGDPVGRYDPLLAEYCLCTGSCYLTDFRAVPGETYYYRFDLVTGSGRVSYGPYAVTVPNTPVGVRVWPNPSNKLSTIELSLPGSNRFDQPLQAEARIIDLQGRVVRTLWSGPLGRGFTSVTWDGRGDAGQALGAGLYFLRVSSPLGVRLARIVRTP